MQSVWTFGDSVPGPVLRVKVGDTVRVTLKNPDTNKLAHSVDFHASLVAWNDEMRTINPGEELVYEFEAKYAGVFMYHCGTSPALHHIASGMFGMIIVEPKGGLPPVDHEFALVQSEWYLGEQGGWSAWTRLGRRSRARLRRCGTGSPTSTRTTRSRSRWGETVRVFVLMPGPASTARSMSSARSSRTSSRRASTCAGQRRQLGVAGSRPVASSGSHRRDAFR